MCTSDQHSKISSRMPPCLFKCKVLFQKRNVYIKCMLLREQISRFGGNIHSEAEILWGRCEPTCPHLWILSSMLFTWLKLIVSYFPSLASYSCPSFFFQSSLFPAACSDSGWNFIFNHAWSFSTLYIFVMQVTKGDLWLSFSRQLGTLLKLKSHSMKQSIQYKRLYCQCFVLKQFYWKDHLFYK